MAPLEARSGVFYEGDRNLYVTPAFLPRLAQRLGIGVEQIQDINLIAVRLRHGASDWAKFAQAAKFIGGNQVFVSHGNVYGIHTAASSAQRGIHLVVVALVLFGTLTALVTLALVGQAVGREIVLAGDDYVRLRVLGATRAQLMGSALVRSGLIAGTGALLALLVAWLASPVMPLGLSRQADIHPGFSFDPLILIPGAVGIGLAIVALSILPTWRVSSRTAATTADEAAPGFPNAAVGLLARSPLSPTVSIGMRHVFGASRGRMSTSVRRPCSVPFWQSARSQRR